MEKRKSAALLHTAAGDNILLFGILAAVILTMSLLHGSFFKVGTFQGMAFQLPEMGLLALAMMITMITGGINLSVIASANVSGILMAMILSQNPEAGWPVVLLAIAVGIAVCILCGVLNGVIVAYFRVPAILATLGVQMLLNGVCNVLTRGAVISGFPKDFLVLGNGSLGFLPVPLLIFIVLTLVMSVISHRLPVGEYARLYGSNQQATLFSGVNCKSLLIKVYAISGFFAGLAAIVLTARFNSAASGYAGSYLLQSVLICVLGGVNPNGGEGRVSGVVLALIILQAVSSGLNLLRVSQYLTMALWGAILLAAIALRLRRSS